MTTNAAPALTASQETVISALFSYPNAPRDCTHKKQNGFTILINRNWRKYPTRAVRQLIKAGIIETWEDGFDLTAKGIDVARARFGSVSGSAYSTTVEREE